MKIEDIYLGNIQGKLHYASKFGAIELFAIWQIKPDEFKFRAPKKRKEIFLDIKQIENYCFEDLEDANSCIDQQKGDVK